MTDADIAPGHLSAERMPASVGPLLAGLTLVDGAAGLLLNRRGA